MKHFTPLDITITDSSIEVDEGADGTIFPFVITDGYAEGVRRYYGTKLWESYVEIHPLAHYDWNNQDPLDIYGTDLHTQTLIPDPTSVPVVNAVTVVYVYENKHYYIAKVTANIDFTTEDITNPANFTDLGLAPDYRYLYNIPIENSIFWKDLGATNRNKCVDKVINSQSTQEGTEVWFEFDVKAIDKIILFNIAASEVKLTLYNPSVGIGSPIYENTKDELINTTSIVNWRTLSQYIPILSTSVDWTVPWFSGTLTARITLINPISTLLKLGEILIGQTQILGLTLDGVGITVKSSGKITELENGDIVFSDEGDITKIYRTFNFTVLFESMSIDTVLDQCDSMINKRIVVFGENTDEAKYRSLIIYGFSRDASPTFESNSTKSSIKFQVQRIN